MAERDARGRFVKGHRPHIGKKTGRPKRAVEEKYLRAFSSVVKIQDFKDIVLTALSRAKAGDLGMVRLFFEYALGKPQQQLQVDVVSDLNIALVWPEDDDLDDSPSGAA